MKRIKRKKKGFTLIELLAIIVILAVIMVIAVPKILSVVNGSKNRAWKNNATAVEKAMAKNITLIDPETGQKKTSIEALCQNPEEMKKIVKLNDTDITCENNVFRLFGKGQFENKLATITCINNKCKIEVNNDIDKKNPLESLEVDGYKLEEKFNKDTLEYHVTVEDDSININAEGYNELASVLGTGEKSLNWGENIFEITVEGEGLNTRTYRLVVNNERPLPPELKGGSDTWKSTDLSVSINKEGIAKSEVKYYEYYVSNTEVELTDDTEGMGYITDTLSIGADGIRYVYYRTISNNNHKSVWSSAEKVMIDKTPNSGSITSSSSTDTTITAVYNEPTSLSGIQSATCYYGTTNNPTSVGTVSGNNCVFSGLSPQTTYYFKKCVTNNANATSCTTVSTIATQIKRVTSWTRCSSEGWDNNSYCNLPAGRYNVRFGANGRFIVKYNITGRIQCNSGAFGSDPIEGTRKYCEYISS